METSSLQEKVRMDRSRLKQSILGNTITHNHHKRNPDLSLRSVLGKRIQDNTRETSRDRSNPTTKRPRQTCVSSTNQLCEGCSSISWSMVDQWMNYDGRFDWRGKLVADVGKRYRNVSPSSTCPLCRQLHAPWIEPFLDTRDATQRKAFDFGDRIHIFRHLRHLPHVNDFPTANGVLRRYGTPYHIAVVPVGGGWRNELRSHMAVHGMVIVMPNSHPESEIFVPQQISKTFNPNVVLPWLKFCKHHKTLCKSKAPEVQGMKLIDCHSKDLVIRDYRPDDRYVALSYVWGKPMPSETPTVALTAKKTPQKSQPVGRALKQVPESKLNLTMDYFPQKQSSAIAVKSTQYAAALLPKKPSLRLPKDIPLTIRDAIQVTKALGYRFLWVDKYCIDQNNEAEKQHQCGRMGDIYAGAQITFFALGSNSDYGLPGVSSKPRFWQRKCTTIGQCKFVSTMPDPHLSIKQSEWATRAWTYQEGLFSTRRLFFTDYQVYFECNAMNCVETFKSNLKILHIRTGQRFRAYHRAGKFVCGNSNQYSHLDVKRNKANHRKIDTIRRCQYQIRQYTKTELTNKDDVLNAFAGIARFYAVTTARIISMTGLPIPFPIARLSDIAREGRDHLSYALAWTHRIHNSNLPKASKPNNEAELTGEKLPWTPYNNPKPQRRNGFPSWSWAGWFGEIGKRDDLPYCWTSELSAVRIGFRGDEPDEDYAWLQRFAKYKQYLIRRLLTVNVLYFDAHVLNPEKLKRWKINSDFASEQIPSYTVDAYLSIGHCSLEELHERLMDRRFECVVLGTHGEPRKDVFKAIQEADKISSKARKRRIDLFERSEPDAIVCLIVYTVRRTSYRLGLLKVGFEGCDRERALKAWVGEKRNFVLK